MNVSPVAIDQAHQISDDASFTFRDAHKGPSSADAAQQSTMPKEWLIGGEVPTGGADGIELDLKDGNLKGKMYIDNYTDHVKFEFQKEGKTQTVEYQYNRPFSGAKTFWTEVSRSGENLVDAKLNPGSEWGRDSVSVEVGDQSIDVTSGEKTPNGWFDIQAEIYDKSESTKTKIVAVDGGDPALTPGQSQNEGRFEVSTFDYDDRGSEDFIPVSAQDKKDVEDLWNATEGPGTNEGALFDVLGRRSPSNMQSFANLFQRVHRADLTNDKYEETSMQDWVKGELNDGWGNNDADIKKGEFFLKYGTVAQAVYDVGSEVDKFDWAVDEPMVLTTMENLSAEERPLFTTAYKEATGRNVIDDLLNNGDFSNEQIAKAQSLLSS